MANNNYIVDVLAPGTATVVVTDDGTGSDWLTFAGVYALPVDIRLSWTSTGGVSTEAMGFYFTSGNVGHRLVVKGLIENVRGSNGADTIQGNEAANILFGDQAATGIGGNDVMGGGDGNDVLYGGTGNDQLSGGGGNDKLFGDVGNDIISGGAGIDQIEGGLGADQLSGGATARDLLSYVSSNAAVNINITFGSTTIGGGGHAAGDTINGFSDVVGSAFSDILADTVKSTVAFGGNDNYFFGGDGNDSLFLGGGNDRGNGGNGNDRIFGELGNDVIIAGAGADTIVGGLGVDTLYGGFDNDRFVFNSLSESGITTLTQDIIVDFRRIQIDRIDLSMIDASITAPGNNAFTFIGNVGSFGVGAPQGQLRYDVVVGGCIIYGNVDSDTAAEFSLFVAGMPNLLATDFFL